MRIENRCAVNANSILDNARNFGSGAGYLVFPDMVDARLKTFLVDGSATNFADVILDNLVTGKTCSVASYGFGVQQIDRLIAAFDQLLLIADESHSQLNPKAYAKVLKMDEDLPHFKFKPMANHAKFALIDDQVIVFTSANLSANRRMESYIIGKFSEVAGIDKLKKITGNPGKIFKQEITLDDIDIGSAMDDIEFD